MRATRVYVAGPYTLPDPIANTARALDAATALLERGYAPYVPHLNAFWHLKSPQPYGVWLNLDLQWIACADVVLRLPGASPGADEEVREANHRAIDVYYSLDSLIAGEKAVRP